MTLHQYIAVLFVRPNRKEGVRTVDELHMTVTGEPVNVVANMSFATMFVAKHATEPMEGGEWSEREWGGDSW